MLECIILVGLQAAGKTTFYRRHFGDSHVHVSMDRFPNARRRAARAALEISRALDAGRSVVVDNTNPSIAVRAPVIRMARARGAKVIGYYLETPMGEALRRNRGREGKARVPDVGIFATAKRLEPPARAEGFHRLLRARICADGTFAVDEWTGDVARFHDASTAGLACRVYVPPGYDRAATPWPLIVFLHADGESGRDNLSQTTVGLGPSLLCHPDRWPFVVTFPQKPERGVPWAAHREMVGALVDAVSTSYDIDRGRRYLTGIAEGGDGTCDLGAADPDFWAALAPVGGSGPQPLDAGAIRSTPVWCFLDRGDAMTTGDVAHGARVIEAESGRIRFTSYEVGAGVEELAYAEPELPVWFLQHERGSTR